MGVVERGQWDFCPFLSNAVDEGGMVLLPVLLSFDGGRFGGPGFLVGSHLSRCSSLLPGWGRVELPVPQFSTRSEPTLK